jgi:N-acetylmuramoyl-L-alanine amidase
MSRDIKYLVVHCTATPQNAKVENIQRYWRENLKWKSSGYHQIIDKDGKITVLASDEKICNGVAGYNSVCLHVSYIGGVNDKGKGLDNRTEAQKRALCEVLYGWKKKYPKAIIQGHKDFPNVTKECPSFDAKKEYADII